MVELFKDGVAIRVKDFFGEQGPGHHIHVFRLYGQLGFSEGAHIDDFFGERVAVDDDGGYPRLRQSEVIVDFKRAVPDLSHGEFNS